MQDMFKVVTLYETTDGLRFETEADAHNWQARLNADPDLYPGIAPQRITLAEDGFPAGVEYDGAEPVSEPDSYEEEPPYPGTSRNESW